jgi:glycosyltransferase involved in cell wall biosynthesis
MNLIHLVPHVDKEAAGPSYSVPRLCESLAQCSNEVELMCLASGRDLENVTVSVYKQWSFLSRFAISSAFSSELARKSNSVDIVHNHSLWSMINVASGWAVPGKKAKLVVSPRGTLSKWALGRSSTLKRLIWPFQSRALRRADLLHATSLEEYEEIRRLGFRAPVAVIPNGIDLPAINEREEVPLKTLLFLSRIHPKKGLDNLLRAWGALQEAHPSWRLSIIGTGETIHVAEVRELIASLKLSHVDFVGPLYGRGKSRAYFNASLFVLPTHSENFGMVVAEALAHGCPAVVTRGAPWEGLEANQCGWWIEHGIDPLITALNTAMSLPSEQLSAMGLAGRQWMNDDFGWMSIANKMDAAYHWIVHGGIPPDCVILE